MPVPPVPALSPAPAQQLPAGLVPVLAEVRDLASTDFAGEGTGGRAGWLVGLRQLVDAAEVAFTHALASFDAAGDGQVLTGAQSSAAWLRAELRLAPGDASGRVHLARQRGLLADTLHAVHAGAVTFDQAAAVEKAVRPLPDRAKPDAVALLTGLAEVTDAAAVRVAGRRLREVVDPDGALTEGHA